MIKYEDYAFFESHVLPLVGLLGVGAIIVYGAWCDRQFKVETVSAFGAWCDRQLKVAAIRKAAFAEAGEALRSLSETAFRAGERHVAHGNPGAAGEAWKRGYYYDRAAMIVRSIPSERA